MPLRALLVVSNLCAWGTLVVLRGPLPDSYFAERDSARQQAGFLFSSGDPALVVAGRPLWWWSEFHGGERLIVKLLEVPNLVPLCVIGLAGAIVASATRVGTHTRSLFTFGALLLLSSGQGWIAGTAVARFRAWRHERHAAAA